jgi:hypothetical protein
MSKEKIKLKYQIRVAGKIFEGTNLRTLMKRAVEAKRQSPPATFNDTLVQSHSSHNCPDARLISAY